MTKHILKLIWNERKHNMVIILELALIALIMWAVVDVVYCTLRNYYSPTGFDIEHTYLVQIKSVPKESREYVEGLEYQDKVDDVYSILERIKRTPGAEVVSLSVASRPGSPGNMFRPVITRKTDAHFSCLRRLVDPKFLEVYRYEPINATLAEVQQALRDGKMIISEDAERELLPNGGTLVGDTTFMDGEMTQVETVIGGKVQQVRYSRFQEAVPFSLLPVNLEVPLQYDWLDAIEYSIRVKPEAMDGFQEMFTKDIAPTLSAGNYRFKQILYNPDQFEYEKEQMKDDFLTQGLLALFLLVNVLLGVAGVFWFRVVKRRGQIGLRISFGATPRGAQWQFILEGLLMLAIALVLSAIIMAVVFQFELLAVELIPLDVRRFVGDLLITALLMGCAVVLAVWLPTRRTKRIPPAQALREE